MTISNEDILKYFMTDEYPHDAGTLAAKEKIEQLQHQLNESDARACRLENGLIGCAKTLREYNEADYHVYLSLTKETKSQSLQHIHAEAVAGYYEYICLHVEYSGDIPTPEEYTDQQTNGGDGDE